MNVTRLGLGCAQLGGLFDPMAEADAYALVDAAWDLGIRYFDTAPYYGFTLSEHRLGAALRSRPRGEYVISTKVGRLMWPDPGVQPGECGWAAPLPFRPHYDYTHDGITMTASSASAWTASTYCTCTTSAASPTANAMRTTGSS